MEMMMEEKLKKVTVKEQRREELISANLTNYNDSNFCYNNDKDSDKFHIEFL